MQSITIDFNQRYNKLPTIKIQLDKKEVSIKCFLSMNSTEVLLETLIKGKKYREAFCLMAYNMFQESRETRSHSITKRMFVNMPEASSLLLMHSILETEQEVLMRFSESNETDVYERFCIAVQRYTGETIRSTFQEIVKIATPSADQVRKVQIESLNKIVDGISKVISKSLESQRETTNKLASSIKAYFRKRIDLDPVLNLYGWGGLSAISIEVANYCALHRENLSGEDVDGIIKEYFSANDYSELKKLYRAWSHYQYFESRYAVLSEIQTCHMQGLYISSYTLSTIQAEGILMDFYINTCIVETREAKIVIKNFLNDAYFVDYKDFDFLKTCSKNLLSCLDERYDKQFDARNPTLTSNESRHKIAHGQVYADITETDSLKMILFLYELYHFISSYERDTKAQSSIQNP